MLDIEKPYFQWKYQERAYEIVSELLSSGEWINIDDVRFTLRQRGYSTSHFTRRMIQRLFQTYGSMTYPLEKEYRNGIIAYRRKSIEQNRQSSQ